MCIEPERTESQEKTFVTCEDRIRLRTGTEHPFIDLTPHVREHLRRSGICDGWVSVQAMHTTAAVVVNEFEPELLEDLRDLLERWAPGNVRYRHDARDGIPPGERDNGHSHARAILLGPAQILNVSGGRLLLGRWQRILLVELDGPRDREISVMAAGARERHRPERRLSLASAR
jgi:secondary thiamine-phosphate synthase enzyme